MEDIITVVENFLNVLLKNCNKKESPNLAELEVGVKKAGNKFCKMLLSKALSIIEDNIFDEYDRCSECESKMEKRNKDRSLKTIFGDFTYSRIYNRCPNKHESYSPLDKVIEIEKSKKVSPGIERLSCYLSSQCSFKISEEIFEELLHTEKVSHQSIQQLSINIGEKIKTEEIEELLNNKIGKSLSKYVFVDTDGAMVRKRIHGEKKKMEAKGAMIWSEKCQISKNRNYITDKTFIGTFENSNKLSEKVHDELFRRYKYPLPKSLTVIVRGDGASWIRTLSTEFEKSRYLLDYYHLIEKLKTRFKEAKLSYEEINDQINLSLEILNDGEIDCFIHNIRNLKTSKPKAIERLVKYLEKNKDGLWYKEAKEKGIPIGTGTAEKTVDLEVCRRFKMRGMSWKPDNADNILKLRLLVLNSIWSKYWNNKYYKTNFLSELYLYA